MVMNLPKDNWTASLANLNECMTTIMNEIDKELSNLANGTMANPETCVLTYFYAQAAVDTNRNGSLGTAMQIGIQEEPASRPNQKPNGPI